MIVLASPILSSFPLSLHSNSTKLKNKDKLSAFYSAIPKDNVVRRRCEFYDLHNGLVPYVESWSWQKDIVKQRKLLVERGEDFADTLIVLQHHPVYTLGTGSSEANLNFDKNCSPFDLYRTERGGEVTYHGPGQVVMYPIINLRYHTMDLHWYLRALEEVIIRSLCTTFSIKASRVEGLTGVWFGDKKLAAVGIKVSQWITFHGVALNVINDLNPFRQIVPCGIRDRQVGSVKELLKDFVSSNGCEAGNKNHFTDQALIEMTCKSLVQEFCEVFQVDVHRKHVPVGTFREK